jgi:quinol monooxygenase YgiN
MGRAFTLDLHTKALRLWLKSFGQVHRRSNPPVQRTGYGRVLTGTVPQQTEGIIMNDHPLVALIRAKVKNPSRPFSILAEFEAQPGRGDAVRAAILNSQVVRLTRLEPGCVAYDLYRDADSPDRSVLYERWRDLAALADHLGTAHFAAVGEALAGLLATPPAIRVLTPAGERK